VSDPGQRGPVVVIDTDVLSADLVPRSVLAQLYPSIVTGRLALISFQTEPRLGRGAHAQALIVR